MKNDGDDPDTFQFTVVESASAKKPRKSKILEKVSFLFFPINFVFVVSEKGEMNETEGDEDDGDEQTVKKRSVFQQRSSIFTSNFFKIFQRKQYSKESRRRLIKI